MKGKFNIFQRTMLLWNSIHPYNAVHVVKIPVTMDIAKLEVIIKDLLNRYGLGELSIDHKKKRFNYHNDSDSVKVSGVDPGSDPTAALNREIQRQINLPFTGDTLNPFRFFTVAEDSSFFLGLTYFHPAADADSVIIIIKNIVSAYIDDDKRSLTHPQLDPYSQGSRSLFLCSLKDLFVWAVTLPEHIAKLRSSLRPKYRDINDHDNAFSFFSIRPQQFHLLLNTAKKWGVTLNDMFLAFLLSSLSPFASGRFEAARRKKISAASIVNARRDLTADDPDAFGLFLGSFSVSHTLPEGISLEQLAKDIHAQTEQIKKYKLYLRTIPEMRTALFLISLFFKKRLKKFYSKYYPLWGGITNMNFNNIWKQTADNKSIDYFRTVSTGPTVPVVFSFTTVGDALNVGVSYRTAAFSREEADRIIANFSDCVASLG